MMREFREKVSEGLYAKVLEQVMNRSLSPWEAVRKLLKGKGRGHLYPTPVTSPIRRGEKIVKK
jgi:hypothetical protein